MALGAGGQGHRHGIGGTGGRCRIGVEESQRVESGVHIARRHERLITRPSLSGHIKGSLVCNVLVSRGLIDVCWWLVACTKML